MGDANLAGGFGDASQESARLFIADHAKAFIDYCEDFGLIAGNPQAFPVSMVAGVEAGAYIELSKMLGDLVVPVGKAVIGVGSGQVACASFEPNVPLAVGPLGGDASDEVYPLLSKEMSAVAEGFKLWKRSASLAALAQSAQDLAVLAKIASRKIAKAAKAAKAAQGSAPAASALAPRAR